MKIGVFQFSNSGEVHENLDSIFRGIKEAAIQNVRLLVFQECALCGYPPIEVESRDAIDFQAMAQAMETIQDAAQAHEMYIAVGLIRKEGAAYYNSTGVISPTGQIGYYDKRALWGWDVANFIPGENSGIFEIDGLPVAFRICFDVRFPETFRDCFMAGVPLCFVSFCDVENEPNPERYDRLKAHLVTRAVENIMTVVSVDSISQYQTAPTAMFNPNGYMFKEAPLNQETLLVHDFTLPEISFGMKGRIENSRRLTGMDR
ncbi:carbon-nitrogen hydrolase family protein [bacterium]|nr:carbon-nitrogen hydrolase family protein [bacterium]